ncbi:MAG: molybdopterin-dependent oxidoreductase [Alphaproteobacteria bacterium]|nr:molybdopterin-dependent oxidoreductase [Alphaproteobacteria bacterium]
MTERDIIRTSCPRDCYDGCGIAVVRRNGKITRVLGDPDHPVSRGSLCGKCAIAYNGVWLDRDSRLLHPLRRTGPKGSGLFERVSWEEALGTIASHLDTIIAENDAASILHTHYTGTCSALANAFPERFFNRIGATEAIPDSICNNAGHQALHYALGSSVTGFDPATARDSACIVVWGANPAHSAPHAHKHWLKESRAKVVVIDPVRHLTASQADMHLQVNPGSDAVLAFGLCHIARRDGLLDDTWIASHVKGYHEVEETIAAADPESTSRATGVPVSLIEEAAHLYATGPSLLWLGQGLQRQFRGGNIFRACAMLPALTGNISRPGTGIFYLNSTLDIMARKGATPPLPVARATGPSISQMDVPAALDTTDRFRAYMVWNCNPLASNPAQKVLARALTREDLFTVVVDCFQTDTTRYADIVLPAASFLEFDDVNASYFHLLLAAQVQCAEPMGESLPNQEIFRRLARAMGLEDAELHCTDRELIDEVLEGTGVSWEELKTRGWAAASDEPLVLWPGGRFATPSGKIEIASASAEADGHPRVPEAVADPPPEDGRFRLLSPAGRWLMNSSYGNDPRIGELLGSPTVTLHPDDAATCGVSTGDEVSLSNDAGSLTLIAVVSDAVPSGVLLTDKSRWPGPGGTNINSLHIPRKSDMGESTCVHGVEVTLTR